MIRQKGDNNLIEMLNKVRVSELDNQTEKLMWSKFILKMDPNYPKDALPIFAENNRVRRYNNHMLSLNSNSLYNINANDIIPKNVSQSVMRMFLNPFTKVKLVALLYNIRFSRRSNIYVNFKHLY